MHQLANLVPPAHLLSAEAANNGEASSAAGGFMAVGGDKDGEVDDDIDGALVAVATAASPLVKTADWLSSPGCFFLMSAQCKPGRKKVNFLNR